MTWFDQNVFLIQGTFTAFLFALSIQVPLRFGVYSFSGVGSFALGAYTTGILVVRYELHFLLSVAAAGLLAAAISYLLSLLVVRLAGLYLAMATVAFDLIIGVLALNGGDLTGGSTGLYGAITDITTVHYVVIAVLVVVGLAFTERGRFGRYVDAVRDDPELALAMGVNVGRRRRLAMIVSGLLGGLAGGLTILQRTSVSPVDISFSLLVFGLTMIAVGGTGSWIGALIGAVIFVWLPSVLAFVGEWQQLVHGVIVVLAAVCLPGGIYGVATRGLRAWRSRRQPPAPATEPDLVNEEVDA